MAEPVLHEIATDPCTLCGGTTVVMEKSWCDPRCWVICQGCGVGAGANTIAEAVTVWRDENRARGAQMPMDTMPTASGASADNPFLVDEADDAPAV